MRLSNSTRGTSKPQNLNHQHALPILDLINLIYYETTNHS